MTFESREQAEEAKASLQVKKAAAPRYFFIFVSIHLVHRKVSFETVNADK